MALSTTFARRPHTPSPSQEQQALIENLKGPTVVADEISKRLVLDPPLTPQAVSMWKKRGIPYCYRGMLCRMAGERGIAVPPDFLVGEAAPAAAADGGDVVVQEAQ